jgi:hypothetical protein
MEKKGVVSGRILDTWGNGLAGVLVTSGGVETLSQDGGRFTISGVLPVDGKVTFTKSGYGSITRIVREGWFDTNSTFSGLEAFLHRTGSLRGRVTTAGGVGIEGVKVMCGSDIAYTDEYGDYTLSEIYPENRAYDVEYSKTGYVSQIKSLNFIALNYNTALDIALTAV